LARAQSTDAEALAFLKSHTPKILAEISALKEVEPADSGDDEQDDEPLGILHEQFQGRKVIGVPGRVLAKGGGVHCITQQIPA
jgi:hypothetical protein